MTGVMGAREWGQDLIVLGVTPEVLESSLWKSSSSTLRGLRFFHGLYIAHQELNMSRANGSWASASLEGRRTSLRWVAKERDGEMEYSAPLHILEEGMCALQDGRSSQDF